MKLPPLRLPRGLTARLLATAVLPATLMSLVVSAALYVNAVQDVRRDVNERGRLVALALAESSQYGLVSGNLGYIDNMVKQLLDSDRSIVCIQLRDANGRDLLNHCRPQEREAQSAYEAPVRIESLGGLDLFDLNGAPELTRNLRQVGTVRVTMSAAPIFMARLDSLGLGLGVVLAVGVASCLIAWRLTRRLRLTLARVLGAVRDIRRGAFAIDLPANEPDELGELQRAIVQMAAALSSARDHLEHQVRSRTRELHQAVDQIREADAEKRRLITHGNALIEDDRKRVAAEIHDHLGASLISVRLEASALAARASSSGDEDMARSAQRIADTVQQLYSSTRDIVKSLRPEVLDTLGLAGALEELVSGFERSHPDCHFRWQLKTQLPTLPHELAMQIYRLAQEGLTNIIKHAQAHEVSVTLGLDSAAHAVVLEIRDDGRGFDPRLTGRQGLGLIGMRERVASVGGELSLSSAPGLGTLLTASVPMPG